MKAKAVRIVLRSVEVYFFRGSGERKLQTVVNQAVTLLHASVAFLRIEIRQGGNQEDVARGKEGRIARIGRVNVSVVPGLEGVSEFHEATRNDQFG